MKFVFHNCHIKLWLIHLVQWVEIWLNIKRIRIRSCMKPYTQFSLTYIQINTLWVTPDLRGTTWLPDKQWTREGRREGGGGGIRWEKGFWWRGVCGCGAGVEPQRQRRGDDVGKTNRRSGRTTECVKRTPLSKQGPHREKNSQQPVTHTHPHTS